MVQACHWQGLVNSISHLPIHSLIQIICQDLQSHKRDSAVQLWSPTNYRPPRPDLQIYRCQPWAYGTAPHLLTLAGAARGSDVPVCAPSATWMTGES